MKKPLRIGLIMLGGKEWIGGSEYIKNIILALINLPSEVKQTFEVCLLYSKKSINPDILNQLEPFLNTTYDLDRELKSRNLIDRLRWKARNIFLREANPRMSDFLQKVGIDFIYPYQTSTREEKLNLHGCPWIADFQHKYLPHLFTESEIIDRDKSFKKIATSSQRVVLSSNSAAKDFQTFFPNSKTKVEVLQFRTSLQEAWYKEDAIAIQQKYSLPDRFFLVSNQFWQHKNHGIIFEALKILKSKSIYPVIAYTGSTEDYRNPNYMDTILKTIQEYSLESQTYLLGLIPKQDQMQLMRRSIAVIQPSLFEGWSTVVEDARCLGKTMLLSDFSVHLEQNPPNSSFFERHSPQQLAHLIDECWNSPIVTPDLEQEALARDRNAQETQEFAYRFLAIANGNK
ncbi:MAG: glycosyltransferase [Pseudanabaena frigida]|uniref:Glycosyltransferase n=1 Tax=Pseudanabaena frigida TaxID=945775 RepID=A0A2W4W0H9_9CYAN|nr:MAG: glycosyltransferase [Pseudanabaena frigida]